MYEQDSTPRNLLAEVGFEPTRPVGQGILSPQRLPFRHSAGVVSKPGRPKAFGLEAATQRAAIRVLYLGCFGNLFSLGDGPGSQGNGGWLF